MFSRWVKDVATAETETCLQPSTALVRNKPKIDAWINQYFHSAAFSSTLLPRSVRSQSNSAPLLLMTCRQLKIYILHSRGCQRLFPASPSEAGIFSRCGRTSEERLRPQLPAAERSEVFAAQLRWAKFNISWTIYWSCAFPIFSQFSPAMFWMTHWYFTVFLLLPAMLFLLTVKF